MRNLVAHGDAREGKGRGYWRMEWVASTFTPPPNVVYPALLKPMRTPRLPAVVLTDTPTDLNGLVRFGERRNLVSALCHHVPRELYLVPLSPRYFPQYPILEHSSIYVLTSKWQTKFHTKSKRSKYSFVYFNLYISGANFSKHSLIQPALNPLLNAIFIR